uniref:Glycosyltransferase family A protein n=1 Tax=Roseihalotalea indica TaxID=2867963 RepID=A0AA49GH21_9BACT|nr:glycosyltransferase family A protein [Tunicatimonas sp. TK19036]
MFRRFRTPDWLSQHTFTYEHWQNIPEARLLRIKDGLRKFQVDDPLVTICVPVWNEEENLLRTLSSFSSMRVPYSTELLFVNNNSTDATQAILDYMNIRSIHQPKQGIAHTRLMGLQNSRGKYSLCCDGDSIYPPDWIETMITPLEKNDHITLVYGLYSYVPEEEKGRFDLGLYEIFAELSMHIRRIKREFINVRGFNFGFRTQQGLEVDGFNMPLTRTFDSDPSKGNYVVYGEDGRMGRKMSEIGKIQLVSNYQARVWTSPRRLMKDGSILNAFVRRLKSEGSNLYAYTLGPKKLKHTTDNLLKEQS